MKRVIALLSIATISSAGVIPSNVPDFSYSNTADDIFSNYNPFWCWNWSFTSTYFGNCDTGITDGGTSGVDNTFGGDQVGGDQVIFSLDPPYVEGQIVGALLEVKFGKLFLEGDILISERDKYEMLNLYENTTNFSTVPAGLGFNGDALFDGEGGFGSLPRCGDFSIGSLPLDCRKKRSLIVRINDYASFNDELNNEEHNINKRSLVWRPNQKWKKEGYNYFVPYYIDPSIDKDLTLPNFTLAVNAIQGAMQDSYSKIIFRNLTEPNGDYVHVESKDGHGCYSELGRQGGRQELMLENGECESVGIIIHELLHAVGFLHEQSRSDRDDFVKKILKNIEPNKELNFKKRKKSLSLGSEYDYKSIMHYALNAFAMFPNSQQTLELLKQVDDPSKIGVTDVMSEEDIKQLKELYN